MQRRLTRTLALTTGGALAASMAVASPVSADSHSDLPDFAREVLPEGDGWGSAGAGTTGGADATEDNVFHVSTRQQLEEAVAGDEPKIVVVEGTVDGNTDEEGNPLSCEDYAVDGYSLDEYLATYDPEVWGWDREPSGPLEEARAASQDAQSDNTVVRVGSNTTLVGEPGATITGTALRIRDVNNVIVRGLTIENAFDCFPQWDPTDGDSGAWNSDFDAVEVSGSTNVWLDHNEFSDGDLTDKEFYFGRPYEVHDGLVDIVRQADLVTMSWNKLHTHDKVMLIGNSDSRTTDRGHLRVTLHHNEWRDMGQRTPRVRFGQVDVYNNHYVETGHDLYYDYSYSWGVGKESKLVAEHNHFTVSDDFDPAEVVQPWGGEQITEEHNLVNREPVDLLGAYLEASGDELDDDAGWTPTLRRKVHPAQAVPAVVSAQAGPDWLYSD